MLSDGIKFLQGGTVEQYACTTNETAERLRTGMLGQRFPATRQPVQVDVHVRSETIHCNQPQITPEIPSVLRTKTGVRKWQRGGHATENTHQS